jgi:hypothetical protein
MENIFNFTENFAYDPMLHQRLISWTVNPSTLEQFLSPDPVLQSPGNTQNHNRYSYCLNNPLKYTDPSGYSRRPEGWNESFVWIQGAEKLFGNGGPQGAGSGNHWSDVYRSEEMNFGLMSSNDFIQFYGQAKYDELNYFINDQLPSSAVKIPNTTEAIVLLQATANSSSSNGGYIFDENGNFVTDQGWGTGFSYLAVLNSDGEEVYFSLNGIVSLPLYKVEYASKEGMKGLPENDFVKYSLEGTGICGGTVQAGFDAAKKTQPTVSSWIKGAKVLGKTSNVLGIASIGYDFATGTANMSTVVDGVLFAGGAAVVFFASAATATMLAPWIAGVGVLYGIVSIAGGEAWLDKNVDISEYINVVKSSKP